MGDGVVLVQQAANGDRAIDNEVVTVGAQTVYRQRITLATLTSLATSQVTVTATQVAIPTTNLTGRKTISVEALGANAANVYIGLTGVTATTGWELAAGASIDLDLADSVQLYAVAASGSQKISVLEVG